MIINQITMYVVVLFTVRFEIIQVCTGAAPVGVLEYKPECKTALQGPEDKAFS